MIKANELRIGNIVQRVKTDDIMSISPIDFSTISNADLSVKGIPITPALLEKCGFEYGKTIAKCNDDDVNSDAWSIQISNSDWLEFQTVKGVQAPAMTPTEWPEWKIVSEFSWMRQGFWSQPKHLHELQNLFLALTGHELKIKL